MNIESTSIPPKKLLIATPFYETKGFSPYITSLVGTVLRLQQERMQFGYMAMTGDAYIARVRNTIANQFLFETDATHLFFLDSDIAWQPDDFYNLIMTPDVDVVGCAYPIKNSSGKYTCVPLVDDTRVMTRRDDGLLLAATLSMGFTMISRRALEVVHETFPEHFYVDGTATVDKPTDPNAKWLDFFGHIRVNDVLLGEDYSFCFRCAKAGVKVWIKTTVPLLHFGVGQWGGAYEEVLQKHAPDGKLPVEMATWKMEKSAEFPVTEDIHP